MQTMQNNWAGVQCIFERFFSSKCYSMARNLTFSKYIFFQENHVIHEDQSRERKALAFKLRLDDLSIFRFSEKCCEKRSYWSTVARVRERISWKFWVDHVLKREILYYSFFFVLFERCLLIIKNLCWQNRRVRF